MEKTAELTTQIKPNLLSQGLGFFVFSIIFLSICPTAQASLSAVYIAQNSAGGNTGVDCADAYALSFFNNGGNWGAGASKIGPGTTVYLCGTFTAPAGTSNYIQFQGSGTSGNNITLYFEPGAVITAPYWSGPIINLAGDSYITVDGGTNGTIQATANGTNLANQQDGVTGIYSFGSSNVEIKDLTMSDLYVHVCNYPITNCTDDNSGSVTSTSGVQFVSGSNITVDHNTFHDMQGAIGFTFYPGALSSNFNAYSNTIYNVNWGITMGDDGNNSVLNGSNSIHDNIIHDFANWDDAADHYHHDGIYPFMNDNGSLISGLQIYNNYIYGDPGLTTNTFIYLSHTAGSNAGGTFESTYVFNNLLVNTATNTTHIPANGLYQDWGTNITFVNNTMVGISLSGTYGGNGCMEADLGTGAINENNVCTTFVSGAGLGPSPSSFATIDYNDYYNVANVGTVWGGAYCTTLSCWQGTIGPQGSGFGTLPVSHDMNSITSNPNLNSSYVPQSGSPVIGTGVNLTSLGIAALNVDKAGNPRPASGAWSMGAYAPNSNIYIAQSAAGNDNGEDCADAYPVTWFNTSSNWAVTPSAGKIGPGTTVHLCGTITTELQINGSGISGNVIEVLWESGAKISLPVGSTISLNGNSYLLFDGGSPCGPTTTCSTTDTGTGIIENTANGSTLANQSPSVQAFAGSTWGNIEIRNLIIRNLYQHTLASDVQDNLDLGTYVILARPATGNLTVHDSTFHDLGSGIRVETTTGSPTFNSYNLYIYNDNWGFENSGNGSRTFIAHNIHFGSTTNWDTGTADVFHHNGFHFYMNVPSDSVGTYLYNNLSDGNWGTCCTTATQLFTEVDAPDNFNFYNNVAIQYPGNLAPAFEYSATTGVFANNTVMGVATTPQNVTPINIYSSSNVTFENNAIEGYGQYVVMGNTSTPITGTFADIDYNVYGAIGISGNAPWQCGPTGANTFPAWQEACTADAHGSNPAHLGVNASGIPQAGSALIGAGVNLTSLGLPGLNADINGNARPATGAWDVGAYVYNSNPTAPLAPTNLTATAGNDQVALTWTASSGATSYNVQRSTSSNGTYTSLNTGITTASYTDTSAVNGTTYYYEVQAVNAVGSSAFTSPVSATPQAPASTATINVVQTITCANAYPTVCTLSQATGSGNLIVVAWSNAYQTGSGATVSSITDNKGNVYTEAGSTRAIDSTSNDMVDIWYAKNSIAGATTITITSSSSSATGAAVVWEVSGIDPNSPLDQSGVLSNQTATSTASGPSLTVTAANEFIVSVVTPGSSATGIAAGNAFTNDYNFFGNGWAHLVTSSAGTYSAQWDLKTTPTDYASSGVSFKAASSDMMYGDVNGDGKVSIADAEMAAQAAVGLITLTSTQQQAAEVDGTGKVDIYDAFLIAEYSVGLITKFPVQGG